jgi:uracil-DNA glycosylase
MEGTVYLEDIETPRGAPTKEDTDGSTPSKPVAVASTQVKRQRTLLDMFSGPQGKTSEPSAKKMKLSASFSSSSSNKNTRVIPVNGVKATGAQKLNSIPFSLSSFQDSLTEEEKRLLMLECEVMGKSW